METIPLPFQCPDLVMPISGKIQILNNGVEFTTVLSDLEKKLLLGLKLSISDDLETKSDQWIVWMAYREKAFVLHMWKPLTGEIKQINLTNSTMLPDFDETGTIKSLRVTYHEFTKTQSFHIFNENFSYMDDLCQLLEVASLASPKPAVNPKPVVPAEFIKTASKEDLLRDSSLTNRDSDPSVSAEDEEKLRKRKAIGSVSMRRLSMTGRTLKKTPSGGEGSPVSPREQGSMTSQPQFDDLPPPPTQKPELTTKKSVMSSVFGSITEDDSDGARE